MHMKGASEIVLGLCTQQLNEAGQPVPLPDHQKKKLLAKIEDYASQSLRTLCLAYKYARYIGLKGFVVWGAWHALLGTLCISRVSNVASCALEFLYLYPGT
jgi:magnesium-transporting ATPase (P-type)